jgi:hypothetical protein
MTKMMLLVEHQGADLGGRGQVKMLPDPSFRAEMQGKTSSICDVNFTSHVDF